MIPSSSSLPLVRLCPASFALPHGGRSINRKATLGDAKHEHMDQRAKLGVPEALENISELARKYELSEREASIFQAQCYHFEWSPPPGSYGEVALCLTASGSVERIKGGKGRYAWPDDAVTGGTLDLMWAESGGRPVPFDLSDPARPRCPDGAVLWVPDVKTGEPTWVERVEENYQVLTNALLAARWTGARRVMPAVIFWGRGQGEWDVPTDEEGRAVPWGEREMREHERQIRDLMAKVREEQRRAAAGEPLNFTEGAHCEFCPARARCPEHTALIKRVVSDEIAVSGDAPLTERESVWLAEHLGAIERFAKQARALLTAHTKANGPVKLRNGNEWGAYPRQRTHILVEEAVGVLETELGPHASAAIVRTVSRATIEAAAKEALTAQGKKRGVAPIMRSVMGALGRAGALVTEDDEQYGQHKPGESGESDE